MILSQTIRTTFSNAVLDQTIRTTFSNAVFEQTVRATFSDAVFDQTVRTTFSNAVLDQAIGTTFSDAVFDQTIGTTFSDDRVNRGSGKNVGCKYRESDAEEELAFHGGVLRGVISWYGADVTRQDFYENFIGSMVNIDASDGSATMIAGKKIRTH